MLVTPQLYARKRPEQLSCLVQRRRRSSRFTTRARENIATFSYRNVSVSAPWQPHGSSTCERSLRDTANRWSSLTNYCTRLKKLRHARNRQSFYSIVEAIRALSSAALA